MIFEILFFLYACIFIYGVYKIVKSLPSKASKELDKIKNIANYGLGEWITALLLFGGMVAAYSFLF
jgi:hypothetical protein